MSNETNVKVSYADPSALGLFGLAMVTWVASYQKLNPEQGLSYVIPWAIFLGAFAQLMAAIIDSKKNNTFGTTAFGGYAFFWMAVGTSWLMKLGFFGANIAAAIEPKQLAMGFFGYLIFSLYMTLAATETNKVLFIIFVLIDFLFVGLGFSTMGIMKENMHLLAAYSEVLIAIFSFYGSAANVINNQFGRVFLPIGKPFGVFKK